MNNRNHSKIQSVELDMIMKDASFYLDLIKQINSGNSVGILIFGVIPYLSVFVTETYRYFEVENPNYARKLKRDYNDILQASRMRIKLFDDRRNITKTFEFIDWIFAFHMDWFVNSHKGPLASLKKAIQPDLGLYMYDSHMISSTHFGLFNTGYDDENFQVSITDISTLSRSVGVDIGEYIANVYCGFGLTVPEEFLGLCKYDIDDKLIGAKDVKSQKYLASVFNGSGSVHFNFCLALILSTINFLHYILRRLVINAPDTFFKLKYITMYHASSSLVKLQNYGYSQNILTQKSKSHFAEIFSDKNLKLIGSESKLRNIFVHYRLQEIPDNKLIIGEELYGLVEHFFRDSSFADLDAILDHQIKRISGILENWLG